MVACLVVVAVVALAFADRQMLRRMSVVFGPTVVQIAAYSVLMECMTASLMQTMMNYDELLPLPATAAQPPRAGVAR